MKRKRNFKFIHVTFEIFCENQNLIYFLVASALKVVKIRTRFQQLREIVSEYSWDSRDYHCSAWIWTNWDFHEVYCRAPIMLTHLNKSEFSRSKATDGTTSTKSKRSLKGEEHR